MPAENQRISEYVLEKLIGAGAFGEVWRAHHHIWTDQFVAIKIPTDPSYVRNLQREGSAVHGLVHPCIVRAIGFDPYADPPYLAMEYVPGTDARRLIETKSLEIADTVAILKQVLRGLGYAHGQGVVHRDVKPENILIHERCAVDGYATEGLVKVTDFGLGKAAARATNESIAYSQDVGGAEAQRIAGTLNYMAPEQRSGEDVDSRADLYACGVMLYEMLTGERPAGTEVPSDLNPAVPASLDEAFRRSYARLDKRYASADEFINGLTIGPPPLPRKRESRPPKADDRPKIEPVPRRDDPRVCPSCRSAVGPADQFCIQCGMQLVERVRRCPQCGAYPDSSDRFCIFCGQNLPAAASV